MKSCNSLQYLRQCPRTDSSNCKGMTTLLATATSCQAATWTVTALSSCGLFWMLCKKNVGCAIITGAQCWWAESSLQRKINPLSVYKKQTLGGVLNFLFGAGISGIVYQFAMHGSSDTLKLSQDCQPGFSANTVTALCDGLPSDRNLKVTFDNWFCSVELIKALKRRGIYGCGTTRANRMWNCPLKPEKELQKRGRRFCDYQVESSEGVVVVRWLENEAVQLASSHTGVDPKDQVNRQTHNSWLPSNHQDLQQIDKRHGPRRSADRVLPDTYMFLEVVHEALHVFLSCSPWTPGFCRGDKRSTFNLQRRWLCSSLSWMFQTPFGGVVRKIAGKGEGPLEVRALSPLNPDVLQTPTHHLTPDITKLGTGQNFKKKSSAASTATIRTQSNTVLTATSGCASATTWTASSDFIPSRHVQKSDRNQPMIPGAITNFLSEHIENNLRK